MADPTPADSVPVELGGKTYQLNCTIGAALQISRANGSFQGVIDRVLAGDLDTIAATILIGAGDGKNAANIPDIFNLVWREGITKVSLEILPYLSIMRSGGVVPKVEGGEGETEGDPQTS